MARRIGTLVSVAALASGAAQSTRAEQQPAEHHVVPLKVLSKLATDKRFETVSGDPAIPGAPFVVRIHAEAGYVIMPHTHEVDENIVVVKGSWALGMGEHFRRDVLESMEVGDYGFAPKNMVHFALSRTATIIQVHGIGPFATKWFVPMYELSDKGVVLKATAGDLGRLEPEPPGGCFSLKLGARVRSEHREGAIVGAQCTPGQLTQYRVEGSDGELFWAQRDELRTL
jgi:hypothetical protein